MKFPKFVIFIIRFALILAEYRKFLSILPKNLENLWLESAIDQIVSDFQSYAVTLWSENMATIDKNLANSVTQKFSKQLPILQINKIDINANESKKFLKLPIVKRPESSISILLFSPARSQPFYEKFEQLLKWVTKFSSTISSKPRTLVIVFGGLESFCRIEGEMKAALLLTWKYKYLDFTFLYIHRNPRSQPRVLQNFVFDNKIVSRNFSQDLPLFPSKLKNMKGALLTTRQYGNNASSKKEYDLVSRGLMNPGHFVFVKHHFCRIFNCTVAVTNNISTEPNIYHSVYFRLPKANNLKSFGVCYDFTTYLAAIPHLKKENTHCQFYFVNFFHFTFNMASLGLLFGLIIQALHLSKTDWPIIKMFYVVLGFRITVRNILKDRFCYFLLMYLSFWMSNVFVNQATDFTTTTLKYEIGNVHAFNNLNLLIETTINPAAFSEYCKYNLGKILAMRDLESCAQHLLDDEDRVCIASDVEIHRYSALLKNFPPYRGLRKAGLKLQKCALHQCSKMVHPMSPCIISSFCVRWIMD